MARSLAVIFAAALAAAAPPVAATALPAGPQDVELRPPAAPGMVRARAVNANAIRITWTDRARTETRYQIYDSGTSRFAGRNATSFVWTGLRPGSWWCFAVRSLNQVGGSAWGPGETSVQRDGRGMWACAQTPRKGGNPKASQPRGNTYYLADFKTAQTYGVNVTGGPIRIGGTTYYRSASWPVSRYGDPAYGEWDLARRCSTLTFTAGLLDSSPSDTRGLFEVSNDGQSRWRQEINFGDRVAQTIDVRGVLRIRLAGLVTAGGRSGYTKGGWGDARVTCSSEPPNKKP